MNKIQKLSFRVFLFFIGIYFTIEIYLRTTFLGDVEGLFYYQIIKTLLIVIFISYPFFNLPKKLDPIIKLILLWGIYVFFTNLHMVNSAFSLISLMYQVLFWPLSILYFYTFFRKHTHSHIQLKDLIFVFCFLLFIFGYQFYQEFTFVNLYLSKMYQLNISYFILLLIPWFFLLSNKKTRNCLIFAALIIICFSMKRTAIVSMGAAMIFGYGIEFLQQKRKLNLKYLISLLIIIILSAIVLVKINEISDGWIFHRFRNVKLDGGTKRLDIFYAVFNLLKSSSGYELLFGHGHNSVRNFMFKGYSAHNDWLECFFDYGGVGLMIYIFLHKMLLRKIYDLFKKKSVYTPAFISSYIIFLAMSFTSHLIMYPYVFTIVTILWGSILGLTSKYNKTKCNPLKWYQISKGLMTTEATIERFVLHS